MDCVWDYGTVGLWTVLQDPIDIIEVYILVANLDMYMLTLDYTSIHALIEGKFIQLST